ncbi:MAG: VacB/RNase II family 3'-5' exoribonuclease [Chlamydiota bacterium]
MKGRSFVSLSLQELIDKLRIPPQHRKMFLDVLNTLVSNDEATYKNNTYRWNREHTDTISGVIRVHPRGFGFVEPEKPNVFSEDIFIPKHLTQNAVDGDKVEVLINHETISDKGPEGRVMSILKRGRTHIAGIIHNIDKYGEITAYVPLLGLTQKVVVQPGAHTSIQIGDRIIMEVLDWGSKDTETVCRFSHYLGHIDDHRCDIKAAIEEYELRGDFPIAAIEEAQGFGKVVKKSDIAGREDFRDLECITIDPKTAKDFDDALTLTTDPKGHYHLGVHIADVTHYVRPDSALDKEAQARSNSTYFPGYCLPMLPKELSNNLCSLRPNVNRLAVSVLMEINTDGELVDYRITRSVIRSCKRFTYEDAKLVLDQKKKSSHYPLLKRMEKLCYLLKDKRYERGSLDLALPELVIIVDDEGFPDRTEYVEYDITHQLVEEFMLKANEVVARHLTEEGHQVAYRVHETPADDNLKDFVALARAFGFELPDTPTQDELQHFFTEAVESPYGQHLAACYIRRMRMAVYSPENIGHYGLSLTHYCHFTSPIRRYADILVHRTLFELGLEQDQLEMITSHCSEQERISARAESSVKLLKKLRLIKGIYDHDPYYEYEAVITSVRPWGITIEILAYMMESFIHISEIGNDYFEFIEREMKLLGKRSKMTYRSGDSVTVMLRHVDFITLESKWDLLSEFYEQESKPKKKRGPKGKRKKRKKHDRY